MPANTSNVSDLTVIFDLDGTLVDTAPDLLAALNHTLEDITDEFLTLDHARNMVGQGALALIEEGLSHLNVPRDEADIDHLLERFLTFYYDNVANNSALFPGIEPLLADWHGQGTKLGVCTNKLERPSRKLLGILDVCHRFETIVGRDTLDVSKPHPRALLRTIEMAGGKASKAIFVGDSITDVKTAKAANVPCILVSFGYTVTPVEELGGDYIIHHFDELESAIAKVRT